MRKLWILGVIGALALLPFAALADTGDIAKAVLSLTDVINISVTGSPSLEITQAEDIAGYAGGLLSFTGDITVTVLALTNYQVYGAYFSDVDESTFGNANELLALDDASHYLPYNSTLERLNPTGGFDVPSGFDFSTALLMLFSGINNLGKPTPGDTATYTLMLNPGNLGDRKAGETINFTIVFVVEDSSTI